VEKTTKQTSQVKAKNYGETISKSDFCVHKKIDIEIVSARIYL
jgi:hypothetical protein